MKHVQVLLASVAVAMVSGLLPAAAQDDAMMMKKKIPAAHNRYSHDYRPLTVGRRNQPMAPAPLAAAPGAAVAGLGAAVAAPFNAVGAVGGPIGFGGSVIGGAVGGATTLATAPLNALLGGPVGISGDAAGPLPIKARYAGTGPVATTFDEGYSQEVPVDKSGPIYQLDTDAKSRVVTPFSLVAFPVTGAVSAATTPFRPAPVVPH